MSHSQQMVEALDRQELEEAEVQFQQALLEDSEAQLLDLGQYLESPCRGRSNGRGLCLFRRN